jgi:LysM repeat protein
MRIKEIISESVKKAEVDWQQWKAAMAASAVQRNVPRGIDAIVYLGIIGDPGNTGLGVKFKRSAQIGMDVSPKGQGYIAPGAQAEYNPNDYAVNGPEDSSRSQVGRDFDILFDFQGEPLERQNWKQFQDALSNTLAHELMHRGLAIIDRLPAIKSNIPEPSRTYFEQRWSTNIPGLYNDDQLDPRKDFHPTSYPSNLYLEHMIIYSILSQQSYLSRPENVEYAAQVQKFRKIYMDIEGAAQKYVLSYPIPPGSLAALRSELDGKTPDNVKVDVKIANNVPTVTLTTTIKNIVDKVKAGIGQGIDTVKSVVTPTSEPNSISKVASNAWDAAKAGVSNAAAKTAKVATDTIDTLSNTASAQTLKQLNPQIKDVNRIQVGQKIKLPNGSTYVVKQGDTLDKIAADNSDWLSRLKQLAGF